MKEIFKIIKEHLILLIGTGLFTYGLFSFKGNGYISGFDFGLDLNAGVEAPLYYYYDEIGLFLLTAGAISIVIGLLKIRSEKNKKG
jgi:hypothetical protein